MRTVLTRVRSSMLGALLAGLLGPVLAFAPVAQAAPPSRMPGLPELEAGQSQVSSVWYDGAEGLVVTTYRAAWNLRRDEVARRVPHKLDFIEDTDGTRSRGGTAVIVSRDGKVARQRGDAWAWSEAPLVEGDQLVAVAVDAQGRAYCVGRTAAMYLWEGERWRVFPYPPGPTAMLGATVSAGGDLFVVGERGHLLRFIGGDFDRVIIPGLRAEVNRASWSAVWYGKFTRTLWVRVGKDRLVEIDIAARRGVEHRIPEADSEASDVGTGISALDGVSRREGDVLVLNMGRAIYRFDREGFAHIASEPGLVYDLALVPQEDAVYVAEQSGLQRRSIARRRAISSDVTLDEQEQRRLEREERHQERQTRLRQNTKGFYMPVLRVAPGVSFPLGERPRAGFSFEAGAGVMLTPDNPPEPIPVLWFWPEVGYRYTAHPSRGGHAMDLGIGFGWGTNIAAAFYRPRFAIGGVGDVGGTVFGFRQGLSVQALWGTLGVEVSHQLTGTNRGPQNELHLALSINLAPVLWLAVLWATIPGAERGPRVRR